MEITFVTDLGNIVILLDENIAPNTSAFFLKQLESGTFESTSIYRAGSRSDIGKSPKFLEGGPLSKLVNDKGVTSLDPEKIAMLKNLEDTKLTGLKHSRGAVSLARNVLGGGEVIPDLVFCLTDIPEFDFGGKQSPDGRGFPVFARVVQGLDILDTIAEMERNGETHIPLVEGQILTEPVVLNKVSVRN